MKKTRRDFVKLTGMAGMGFAGSNFLDSFAFGQKNQEKGNIVTVAYASAQLEDGSSVKVPFWHIDSGKEGPTLALLAAQHGNEVQGAEVARRFKDICANELVSGSAYLLPMTNLLAVRSRRHSFNLGPEENNSINPEKLHNMQRNWPGDPQGNDTARLAYAIDQTVLRHCTHMVDMHCWNQFAAGEALSEEVHPPSRAMGNVATTRFISYRDTQLPETGPMMVSQMMLKRGAGVLVIELSGQFQIKEEQVRTGLSTMLNIAKLLGMIKGEPTPTNGKKAVRTPDTTYEISAPCTGIFVPATKNNMSFLCPDDYVKNGQHIGHIIRENDLETVGITSPVSGYIRQLGACHWGLCDASLPAQHPYTEEGEVLALIVSV